MLHNVRQKRVLIVSLVRKGGGFEHYIQSILKHFTLPYTLYQSKYINPECKIPNAKYMITYTNKISFVINTLFVLPFTFFKLCFITKQYDVLFLPHFHFWNLAFIFAFRIHKKPVVLVEHDGIVHLGDELPLQQYLINTCLKYATHLIFLTNYVKSLVDFKLLANKPIFIIPHGIFAFEGLHTSPKHYTKQPTLLFFGRVSKYKGIELLLEALNTLPEESFHKCIIAGKSSYAYDVSHIKDSILKKIEVIDAFLSQKEITALFNQSHILIMPYIEASQSGVAAIGIANAIPTICTDVGGLKEQFILANSNGGGGANDESHHQTLCALICEPNAKSIATQISHLIQNEKLYTKLSVATSIRSKELQWQHIALLIQNVLQKA